MKGSKKQEKECGVFLSLFVVEQAVQLFALGSLWSPHGQCMLHLGPHGQLGTVKGSFRDDLACMKKERKVLCQAGIHGSGMDIWVLSLGGQALWETTQGYVCPPCEGELWLSDLFSTLDLMDSLAL